MDNTLTKKISYPKVLGLFMTGSLLGVLIEGLFNLIMRGHWETHVVSMWGPFCIIYGIGAAGFYIAAVLLEGKNILVRFLAYACIGSGSELVCGYVLERFLNMYAWDYSEHFMNFRGYISLFMTVVWGLSGLLFELLVPTVDKSFGVLDSKRWNLAVKAVSVFMIVNLLFTGVCITRWSHRHNGIEARNRIERFIDNRYDDELMSRRFIEWHFFDESIK